MALILVGASPKVFTDYPAHSHGCYEIILNTEGEGEAEIGGREYPFSPGTIFVVPPNVEHRKRSEKGFRDVYLNADSLGRIGAPPEPIILADDASRTVEGVMALLLSRYLAGVEDDITETLFGVVLSYIEAHRSDARTDPVIDGVIRAITESCSDPEFRVTEALLATGYSKDHLRRRFHEVTGLTPNEYLQSVRLRYAKGLLRQRDRLRLPIGEIALRCGYYDAAYFCRAFRRATGMTPTEYAEGGAAVFAQ